MECTVRIHVLRIVRKVAVTLWMEHVLDVLMDIPDQRVKKVISLDSKSYMFNSTPNQKVAYRTVLRHMLRPVTDIAVIFFVERV